jgi:uncharacterized protein (TIGR03083 family)
MARPGALLDRGGPGPEGGGPASPARPRDPRPLDRTWLLATARAEREALGRTIQYTPPAAWEEESVVPGWRNRDLVAHLAASDALAAAAVAGEPLAELEEYRAGLEGQPFSLAAFDDWTVRRRAEEPFRALVRAWGRSADLFLARAGRVPPGEWATRRVAWVAGEIGLPYLVQSRVAEWWVHGEDLLLGGGNPPRLEHGPIFCLNDLAVRMIPYSLSLAGLSFPGRTVRVELDAVGGGVWHQALAPREVAGPEAEPDALIRGRAHAFALVAARRVPAEDYLAEGVLITAGDDGLAEAVLLHLRVEPP